MVFPYASIVVLVIIAVLILVLRKGVIQLFLDCVLGTIIYGVALFTLTAIFALPIPPIWAEWFYPITVLGIIAVHLASNMNGTSKQQQGQWYNQGQPPRSFKL